MEQAQKPSEQAELNGRNESKDADLVPLPVQDRRAGRPLNRWQRVAEATRGVIAPANAVTAAGLAIEAAGCRDIIRGKLARGVGIMAAGAACDFIDGQVARGTRTANYTVGRWFDVLADGAKSAMLAGVLIKSGTYSPVEATLNYGPKVAGWVVNGMALTRGHETKTLADGKVAEATRWVSPVAAVVRRLAHESGHEKTAVAANVVGKLATVASLAMGIKATVSYVRALGNDEPRPADNRQGD